MATSAVNEYGLKTVQKESLPTVWIHFLFFQWWEFGLTSKSDNFLHLNFHHSSAQKHSGPVQRNYFLIIYQSVLLTSSGYPLVFGKEVVIPRSSWWRRGLWRPWWWHWQRRVWGMNCWRLCSFWQSTFSKQWINRMWRINFTGVNQRGKRLRLNLI